MDTWLSSAVTTTLIVVVVPVDTAMAALAVPLVVVVPCTVTEAIVSLTVGVTFTWVTSGSAGAEYDVVAGLNAGTSGTVPPKVEPSVLLLTDNALSVASPDCTSMVMV